MMEKSLDDIKSSVKRIFDEINETSIKFNREIGSVNLMAVTKMNSAERVNAAIEAGINLLGENRVQEYLSKINDYRGTYTVDFIGHLQTNKVKQIIDKVDVIESVGSLSLAECINNEAKKINLNKNILLEVNIGKEESKTGFFLEELNEAVSKIVLMQNVTIKGLMCIPPEGETELNTEKYFEKMHSTFIDIKAKKLDNVTMDILSMGMTNDYSLAIKHGSTQIRVGRGIFGERNYKL